MSEEDPETNNNLIWILSTVIGGPLIAGITWLCTKKCKNTSLDINSGCCKFHADEQVRQTIRAEVREIMIELRSAREGELSV